MTNLLQLHLIYGPTASGKSAYALEQARKHHGVIINADSQQLYRELAVLTARPTPEEETLAPHRLYGALAGDNPSDVAKWLRLARMEIEWATASGQPVYIVGGTGMYLHALIHGIADIPDVPEAVLAQAKHDLERMGKQDFFERLKTVDPTLCTRINAGDSQRMIRGYSVWLAGGKPLTFWQSEGHTPPFPEAEFVHHPIMPPRDTIYARCDQRVQDMMDQGACEEVAELLSYGYAEHMPVMRIIGVREIAAYLGGQSSLGDVIASIQQATRNYAKRQMTWFRNKMPART